MDHLTKLEEMLNQANLEIKNGKYEPRTYFKPAYKAEEDGDTPINRNDFRSTIHWEGNIETDSLGQANLVFWNSDAITTFKATLEGFGTDGSIGRSEATYFTQLPFGMRAKVPTIAVTGDIIEIQLNSGSIPIRPLFSLPFL